MSLQAGVGTITATWAPSEGATGYVLYASSTSGVSRSAFELRFSLPSTTTEIVTMGGATFVVVTAENDHGEGEESAELSAIPIAPFASASSLSSDLPGASFGSALAVGDVTDDGLADVLVGAPNYGSTSQGRAFLYKGGSGGLTLASWAMLGESNATSFGAAVAIVGDLNGDGTRDALVGDPSLGCGGDTNCGRAYAFLGGQNGLIAPASWTVSGSNQWGFGAAVAGGDPNGDGLADGIVNVPGDVGGRIWYFPNGGAGLGGQTWTSPDGNWGSVACADFDADGYDDIVVGSGANALASIFPGSPSGPTTAYTRTGASGFGASVHVADLDGDGYSDVIIGGAGEVAAFFGGPAGLSADPIWTETGFGETATSGDLNGDEFIDVLVGDPGFGGQAGADSGRVSVFLGSLTGYSAAAWFLDGAQAGAGLGAAVAAADIDGDGFSDLAVAAPFEDAPGGSGDEGVVHVFRGGATSAPRIWAGQPVPLPPGTPFTPVGASLSDIPNRSHTCIWAVDMNEGDLEYHISPCTAENLSEVELLVDPGFHVVRLSVENDLGLVSEAFTTVEIVGAD